MAKKNQIKKLVTEALSQINNWNKHLDEKLKKEKYEKMAQSSYYFFRGTNFLFWKYFAGDTRLMHFGSESTKTWIQADLHAYNYGIYDNDKGDLVYGLNDFDEACIADFQYDLWRMAASMILIAHENGFLQKETIQTFLESFASSYLNVLENFIVHGDDILKEVTKKNAFGKLDEVLEQVERKENRAEMLKQWTRRAGKNMVFDLSYHKLGNILKDKTAEINKAMYQYIDNLTIDTNNFDKDHFNVLDVAQRISSGTGSYGTPRYYILIKGEAKGKYSQRILDVKFQYKPCAYQFSGKEFQQNYDARFMNEGKRHKEAFESLNSCSNIYTGWMIFQEGTFSVRERSAYKSYFQTSLLNTKTRFNKLAKQWGSVLATSHIKANKDFDINKIVELANLNKNQLEELVSKIAFEYIEFNNTIYKSFINKLFLNEPIK